MDIRATIDDADLKLFYAHLYQHIPAFRRRMQFGVFLAAIALVSMVTLATAIGLASINALEYESLSTLWIPVICLQCFMYYVLLRQVKVHGWRTLLTHPDVLGEHSYTILEQGVNERTARVDSFRRWDLFTRIEASEHHIYLFLSDTAAAIVPVRAFSGRSEAARFLERARASWHASRSLAPGSAQNSEPLGARGDASP